MTYVRLSAPSGVPVPPDSTARRALLTAFARLALSRRYRDFGVEAIVRSAKVARSTFYYHFSGKDDVLLENLRPFIAALAEMPFTLEPSHELRRWVEHIWQQRSAACRLLDGATGRKIEAALAFGLCEAFAARLLPPDSDHPLLAQHVAGGSLSLLKAWVGHRVTATPSDIAHILWRGARSIEPGPNEAFPLVTCPSD
jgi:AcrR family transcriptional regulator